MPGPRPVAANIRTLRGQKPRSTPRYVPMPKMTPPAWLDAVGKAEWRRVTSLTSHQEVIQVVDHAALTGYCVAWSNLVAAAKDVAKRGVALPARGNGEGQAMVKNPSLQIVRDSQATLKAWCRELGFTPAARLGLDMPPTASAGDEDLD